MNKKEGLDRKEAIEIAERELGLFKKEIPEPRGIDHGECQCANAHNNGIDKAIPLLADKIMELDRADKMSGKDIREYIRLVKEKAELQQKLNEQIMEIAELKALLQPTEYYSVKYLEWRNNGHK